MHSTITKVFFALTDTRTKRAVLAAIGQHDWQQPGKPSAPLICSKCGQIGF
jgi:hypothetical protein